MKTPRSFLPVLLILAASAITSHATVLLDTFAGAAPGYGTTDYSVVPAQWMSRSFTISASYTLDSFSVALNWQSGNTEPMTFSLQTDSVGNPSGTSLESFTFNNPGGDGGYILTDTSSTHPLLAAGTYHLVGSSAGAGLNKGWAYTGDGHQAILSDSTNLGTSWATSSMTDVAVQINATAVPEPSALVIAALGLAFTGLRRRQ